MRRFNLIIALPAFLIMNMGSPQQEAHAAATFTPSISTKWSTRTVAWFLVFRSTFIYFVPAFVYQAPWVNAFSNGVVFAPLMGWSSWNSHFASINASVIEAAANAVVSSGMKSAGEYRRGLVEGNVRPTRKYYREPEQLAWWYASPGSVHS